MNKNYVIVSSAIQAIYQESFDTNFLYAFDHIVHSECKYGRNYLKKMKFLNKIGQKSNGELLLPLKYSLLCTVAVVCSSSASQATMPLEATASKAMHHISVANRHITASDAPCLRKLIFGQVRECGSEWVTYLYSHLYTMTVLPGLVEGSRRRETGPEFSTFHTDLSADNSYTCCLFLWKKNLN